MQSRLVQKKTFRFSLELGAVLQNYGKCLHTSAAVCSSFEREYLHKTHIPTYHFQKSLPRLPVPELEKSCQRYLNAQLPLMSEAEHKELQKVVAEFQTGRGPELHKQLVAQDKANKHTNYVCDLWFDMYLKDRRPVVLTHNPFITFKDDPRPEYNTQLIRSANMLISSVRCMKTMRDEYLEPEVFHLNPSKSDTDTFRTVSRLLPPSLSWYGAYLFKAFPLDMSQYKRLFNSCRIPRPEKDELFTDKDAKHVLVMRKGNLYVFDVLDKDGNIIPDDEVVAHLQYIQSDTTPGPEFPVSTLTSDFRDIWSTARQQLVEADPANETKLCAIESAVFSLSLDDDQPEDPNAVTRSMLYGDGINRWYDKSFQLLFTKEGTAALQFEHAWGDGVAVLRYINEVFKDSTQKPRVNPQTKAAANADSSAKVKRLDFTLTPQLKETITKSKQRFDEATGSLDAHHLQYLKMTRKDIKQSQLNPDSIMQLVIQLAHYQIHHKNRGTYESCSTSAFKQGRTETVRPCTVATAAMCEKMYGQVGGSQASAEELMEGLKECGKTHGKLTREAAMGNGFDRHLFCLKHLAEQQGLSLPMFTHPAYAHLNHIILSTSTLTAPSVVIGGFAAVTPDGYGIGYGITDEQIGFNVTTYPACNVRDFISCCETALNDIHKVIQVASKS